MSADLLHLFNSERQVEYQGEEYLVRDNGAVMRLGRSGQRNRPLDGAWTFGRPSASTGYMQVGAHVVHRIVAFAFHEQPSEDHVVDHIDTNRRNNRADNLRWVTRLENLLSNPVTRARIERAYGSLEAFFADPSSLGQRVPDFSWMRPVSTEEAEASRKRLLKWAESDRAPQGGRLGEWIYGKKVPRTQAPAENRDVESFSPLALQRKWKTRGAFPACPEAIDADWLNAYRSSLSSGSVFFTNENGEALVESVDAIEDRLVIVTRMPEAAVKGWAVAQVYVESGHFIHEARGTFFTRDGAINLFNELLGNRAPHIECLDDYT